MSRRINPEQLKKAAEEYRKQYAEPVTVQARTVEHNEEEHPEEKETGRSLLFSIVPFALYYASETAKPFSFRFWLHAAAAYACFFLVHALFQVVYAYLFECSRHASRSKAARACEKVAAYAFAVVVSCAVIGIL